MTAPSMSGGGSGGSSAALNVFTANHVIAAGTLILAGNTLEVFVPVVGALLGSLVSITVIQTVPSDPLDNLEVGVSLVANNLAKLVLSSTSTSSPFVFQAATTYKVTALSQ